MKNINYKYCIIALLTLLLLPSFIIYGQDNTKDYKMIENKNIIIYTKLVPMGEAKTFHLVLKYFFSIQSNTEILPLTQINLKRAFPDNLKFHDMLNLEFDNKEDISTFDQTNKMFKVNYLLNKSLK